MSASTRSRRKFSTASSRLSSVGKKWRDAKRGRLTLAPLAAFAGAFAAFAAALPALVFPVVAPVAVVPAAAPEETATAAFAVERLTEALNKRGRLLPCVTATQPPNGPAPWARESVLLVPPLLIRMRHVALSVPPVQVVPGGICAEKGTFAGPPLKSHERSEGRKRETHCRIPFVPGA